MFYYKDCLNVQEFLKRNLIVVPVYYWPGQTIRLRCYSCEKSQIYNGKLKYWSVLKNKPTNFIDNPEDVELNKKWIILQEDESVMEKVLGKQVERTFPQWKNGQSGTPKIRMPRIEQQNGYLIISNVSL